MDAIEKRARELLAAEIEKLEGYKLSAAQIRAGSQLGPILAACHAAIIAALTPPEDEIERAAKALHAHGADNLCNDVLWGDLHQSEADQFRSWARAALLAARPEVP